MKIKIYSLFCYLFLLTLQTNAQNILQLKTDPTQPTTNTPVKLIADVQFSSGDCKDKTLTFNQVGNKFETNAIHCLGALSVICYDSDTFNIGLLPAGNYRFFFHVETGIGPSPCSPGIVPGPDDSIDIVVTVASGLPDKENKAFSFHPNPADDNVNLRFAAISNDRFIRIQNLSGATLLSAEAKATQLSIGLSEFSSGIYFIEVYENGNCTGREKLVKN